MSGDAGPVLLVNPPSPQGRTINREGFGGLGVLTPGPRGFVYPAQRLAEAAGFLKSHDRRLLGLDFALEDKRSQKAWKRCDEPSGAIVHISTRAIMHDLNVARTFQRSVGSGTVVLTGVGLESHRDSIEEMCPGAIVDTGATGYGAARTLLQLEGELGPPDSWPDACWSTLPLARSRRLPVFHARGCTHACDYCPYVIATGRELVSRSPERTLSEIAAQSARHKPKRLVFRDPAFALARESALQVLSGLARMPKKMRPPFEIESRPELLTDEVLDALRDAGCAEIKLGVETLEASVLVETRRVEDPISAKRYVESAERVLQGVSERKLTVRPYLMQGLPGATPTGDADSKRRVAQWASPEIKKVNYPEEGVSRILG